MAVAGALVVALAGALARAFPVVAGLFSAAVPGMVAILARIGKKGKNAGNFPILRQ
jgi:hypothetical protein